MSNYSDHTDFQIFSNYTRQLQLCGSYEKKKIRLWKETKTNQNMLDDENQVLEDLEKELESRFGGNWINAVRKHVEEGKS